MTAQQSLPTAPAMEVTRYSNHTTVVSCRLAMPNEKYPHLVDGLHGGVVRCYAGIGRPKSHLYVRVDATRPDSTRLQRSMSVVMHDEAAAEACMLDAAEQLRAWLDRPRAEVLAETADELEAKASEVKGEDSVALSKRWSLSRQAAYLRGLL